jgi:glucose uptake protein GlcU
MRTILVPVLGVLDGALILMLLGVVLTGGPQRPDSVAEQPDWAMVTMVSIVAVLGAWLFVKIFVLHNVGWIR